MAITHQQLLDACKKEKNPRKARRLWAIYNVVVNNKSLSEVAKIFGICFNTAKNWYLRFKDQGTDGLGDRPRSGRPRIMELETLDKYMQTCKKPVRPDELRDGIEKDLELDTSVGNVRRWLGSLGYTCKTPNPVYVKRAPVKEVLKWQEETKTWVLRLERARFPVYTIDQMILLHDYRKRKGVWAPIGERVFVPQYGDHMRSVICGGVSTRGLQMFRAYDQFTSVEAVDYLAGLRAKHGKYGILWDSLSVHVSGPVKEYLASHKDEIFTRAYPVGWPKLNAMEGIWNVARGFGLMGHYGSPFDHRAALMGRLRTKRFSVNMKDYLYQKVTAITF